MISRAERKAASDELIGLMSPPLELQNVHAITRVVTNLMRLVAATIEEGTAGPAGVRLYWNLQRYLRDLHFRAFKAGILPTYGVN